ncbi:MULTISPECIES: OmpA family protein [Mesonia]|uniref:Outer membrane porin F n=2 Tax=Mesonia TaxID=232115 RepID=A0AC61Y4Z0_9FLAO|nr:MULTISPECIES: OmpA family protein [Mesonia]MAC63170.1 cell envelope biogenesis protein OmpA [Flavobacteriaceae bacterium]MAN27693.1 cell envelope biogenesis protein OmpA [Mesonia sp.]MAQ40191.1 cell envelope biogenesis protein OmpA [Mesonia sp.]VVU99534.1 Outer membrane porin F [Mesonia oceanica]|tara:strand:- start:45 stop:1994 length:1950 start_codon:yes stop_codon:yes gene_type:complete
MSLRKYITKIKGLVVITFLFIGAQVLGQGKKLSDAQSAYSKYNYMEAADIYESVANKGYRSVELFQKLGNSYYLNGRYEDAAKWYGELYALSKDQPNIYNLRYAQSLKSVGLEGLGEEYYDRYLSNLDKTEEGYLSVGDYLDLIEQNSGRYDLKKEPFNSEGIDFGSAYLGTDKMVFASSRDKGVLIRRRSKWDGQPFLNLYEVGIGDDSLSEKSPRLFKSGIEGKYHESTPVFTKDGQTMYFTRTEPKGLDKGSPLYLKIYRAHLVDGKWTGEEDLTINGDTYNTAHPMLNVGEDRLYFVSDRKGGEGQTDLYYAPIGGDGSLGEMVNLGKKINTPGRESFPFISADNNLYFSSDGHFGLGGYDVFYVKLQDGENGIEGGILNVGRPINSSFDDICYVVRDSLGYVSSNRIGTGTGESFDNIYGFIEKEPIRQVYIKSRLHGKVMEVKTHMPIANARVEVFDVNNVLLQTLTTDEGGAYDTEVAYEPAYILKAGKEGYSSADDYSVAKQVDREHDFELEPKPQMTKGTDLAKILNIPMIYFDLDKSNIRPDAEVELQKIVEVLKEYPDMKIDIRSHTDSRASDSYNLRLSDRRAKSTLEYLVTHGIDRRRLTARGYGETMLLNNCSNGVKCSEAEHQLNRRSEFIVIN